MSNNTKVTRVIPIKLTDDKLMELREIIKKHPDDLGNIMDKIKFTQENLSKIHISQLKQFLDKNLNPNYDVAEVREWQGLLFIIIKKKTCYFDKLVNNENNKICRVNGEIESINDLDIFELEDLYKISFHFNRFNFCFESKGKFYEKMESLLLNYLEKKYEQGNLTQFHELFTQVYDEIMGYPIN